MDRNGHRLTRSRDRKIAGVCGGLAEFFGWHPRAVRALFVVATLLTGGTAIVVYALLGWVMPPARTFNLDDFRAQ